MSEKLVLRTKEVAELLDISLPKVLALCHSDGFPCIRVGTAFRIPRKSLEEWLEREANGENDRLSENTERR